jgi:ElaA protein
VTAAATEPLVHDRRTAELDPQTLLDLLTLRVDVFVVEQRCAYRELDGRDGEPATRHLWIADQGGLPVAYLRLLDDGTARRIGRVVTRPDHRRRGLADRLMCRAVATSVGPWVLEAQAHLEGWYRQRGFARTGDTYVDDGIPHVPMRRQA